MKTTSDVEKRKEEENKTKKGKQTSHNLNHYISTKENEKRKEEEGRLSGGMTDRKRSVITEC